VPLYRPEPIFRAANKDIQRILVFGLAFKAAADFPDGLVLSGFRPHVGSASFRRSLFLLKGIGRGDDFAHIPLDEGIFPRHILNLARSIRHG